MRLLSGPQLTKCSTPFSWSCISCTQYAYSTHSVGRDCGVGRGRDLVLFGSCRARIRMQIHVTIHMCARTHTHHAYSTCARDNKQNNINTTAKQQNKNKQKHNQRVTQRTTKMSHNVRPKKKKRPTNAWQKITTELTNKCTKKTKVKRKRVGNHFATSILDFINERASTQAKKIP